MAIIGAIAVTLVLGYIALALGSMAMFPLMGFDEFNIPVGLAFLAAAAVPVVVWWFVVGRHISVSINLGG